MSAIPYHCVCLLISLGIYFCGASLWVPSYSVCCLLTSFWLCLYWSGCKCCLLFILFTLCWSFGPGYLCSSVCECHLLFILLLLADLVLAVSALQRVSAAPCSSHLLLADISLALCFAHQRVSATLSSSVAVCWSFSLLASVHLFLLVKVWVSPFAHSVGCPLT